MLSQRQRALVIMETAIDCLLDQTTVKNINDWYERAQGQLFAVSSLELVTPEETEFISQMIIEAAHVGVKEN